ncbi:hypothetical protein BK809_0003868 [Diplodia seriata]|uniref:Metallo-beta-lactamase domain-containing protein n=1 Tax=Diplodia seriata TaxID=420778 RepID=A0A1S8BCH1_9PEZI|nr:hypothetical protein BK809_0003868 [Diplodia seriata]
MYLPMVRGERPTSNIQFDLLYTSTLLPTPTPLQDETSKSRARPLPSAASNQKCRHHFHPPPIPPPKEVKVSPAADAGGASSSSPSNNASLYFVGTATTILEWEGVRLMTDPNFLHAGDHVHLGPGVRGTRVTEPAISLEQLPRIDAVLLSHYHADHFDQVVEATLRRDLPIVTTPHAKRHLTTKAGAGESFTDVFDLDAFEEMFLDVKSPTAGAGDVGRRRPAVKVTGLPGKHVPPGPAGALKAANEFLQAVPPTNGWMLELGYRDAGEDEGASFRCGYR